MGDSQLAALKKVGLAESKEVEYREHDEVFGDGRLIRKNRHLLTEQGNQYLHNGDICYGKVALDKIDKWEGPAQVGTAQVAKVYFSYKIKDQAAWATDPDMLKNFSVLQEAQKDAGKPSTVVFNLKLTNVGWEVATPF